jgi:hypothetical protein
MSVASTIRKAIARIRNDRRPMCGRCGKTGVRIYRNYGMFHHPETNRCNACISDKSRGWMVPCILGDNGDAWGYGSVPDADVDKFMSLRESSSVHPHWTAEGWSDSWISD